jgi:hypothetical protein
MAEQQTTEIQTPQPIGKPRGMVADTEKNLVVEALSVLRNRLAVFKGLATAYYTADKDEIYLLCDIPEDNEQVGQQVCDIHREIAETYPDIFIELGIWDSSRDSNSAEWVLRGLEKL